ncbi:MFS transporter [Microvirga antarctica]|uniref:MFS transporter n=1 Tax=Microvirga antarctica TaxID=2819233 RepID=UPI001B300B64|nr:MFS transporter [Microvirga antarctica]
MDMQPPNRGMQGTLQQLRAMGLLMVGALILQVAAGILNIIVPVRMALAEQAPTLIGLVASSYAGGFLIGCFMCPPVIRHIGHIRAFSVFGALQAVLALGFTSGDFGYWTLVRFGTGFAGAGAAIVLESWISAQASPSQRGRLFGIYQVLTRIAMIGGQLAASHLLFGASSAFLIVSVCYSLSVIPVCLTVANVPQSPAVATIALRQLWRTAPMSAMGCIYVGSVGSALMGILPAWGVLAGLSPLAASLLSTAVQVGSLITQWPMGYLSDRTDRRRVMMGGTAVTLVMSIILVAGLVPAGLGVFAIFALIGGSTLPVYMLSVSHAFDRADKSQAVGLSSSLLFHWAVGSILGPLLATSMIERIGTLGLPAFIVLLSLAFVIFGVIRLSARRSVDE